MVICAPRGSARWWISLQVALVALGAAVPLWRLTSPVARDYSEGWLAVWSDRAAANLPGLYAWAQGNPLVANNYPPLFEWLCGALAPLTGDALVTGRILGLLGLGAATMLAGVLCRRLGANALAGVATALFVLLYAVWPFDQFLAANNPQWLAEALVLASLLALLPRHKARAPSPGMMALSLGAFALAMLVKHNVVAFVPATLVWFARRYPSRLLMWLAIGTGIAALVIGGLTAEFGIAIWQQVLGYPRVFSAANTADAALTLLRFTPLLLLALLVTWRRRREPAHGLVGAWFVCALVLGLVQRTADGVSQNAFFGATLAALILACSEASRRRGWLAWAAVAAPLALYIPDRAQMRWDEWHTAAALDREQAVLVGALARTRGPVLCEDLALCRRAGKPLLVDTFAYGQRLGAGRDDTRLSAMIADRTIAAVVLDLPRTTRLPAPIVAAIDAGYVRVASAPSAHAELLLPRQSPSQRDTSRSSDVTQP